MTSDDDDDDDGGSSSEEEVMKETSFMSFAILFNGFLFHGGMINQAIFFLDIYSTHLGRGGGAGRGSFGRYFGPLPPPRFFCLHVHRQDFYNW